MTDNGMTPQDGNKKLSITFNQAGKEFAKATNSNPESIETGLDDIYNDFLKRQKLDKNAIDNAIKQLKEDIIKAKQNTSDRESDNKQLLIDNQNLLRKIDDKKAEIVDAENEILEITGGKVEADKTKLYLYGVFATIALIGIILSYMATFGSAILGLEDGDFLIRGSVFEDLIDSGTGNFVLAMFISIIPIACGYFYTKLKKEGKNIGAFSTLLIVLLVDVVIGYLLAKTIYVEEFHQGLHEEEWNPMYILSDISFWIVLVLNFSLYMTFSFLANAFFEEQEKLSPNSLVEQIKNKIALLKEKMEEFKNAMSSNEKKIEENNGEIQKNNDRIEKMEDDIKNYQNGTIPLDVPFLKSLISQYLQGYQAYTNMMITNEDQAKNIVGKVLENAEKWFVEKDKNGWKQTTQINLNKNFFNINN